MVRKLRISRKFFSLLVILLIFPVIIITANQIPNDDFVRTSTKIVDNSNDDFNSSR